MRRFGFHSSNFDEFSIAEAAKILAGLGYDAIELNMEQSPDFAPHVRVSASAREREQISAAIRDAGLSLSSLNAHWSLIDARPPDREAATSALIGVIELAADLKTDIVHVISGVVPNGASESDCWPWMTDALRRAIPVGRDHGVRIAVEAAVFPGFLVWNRATLLQLIDRVGEDDLYVNFDPSHFQAAGDDVIATFKALRPRIIHMHAKDAIGRRDRFEFPPLGRGDVDWKSLADALISTSYDGAISVEYEAHFLANGYPKEPLPAARQSKEFLDSTFGRWRDISENASR